MVQALSGDLHEVQVRAAVELIEVLASEFDLARLLPWRRGAPDLRVLPTVRGAARSAAANVSSSSTKSAFGALRVDGALRFLAARARAMAALPSVERFILLRERASHLLELCRLLGQLLLRFGDALLGRHARVALRSTAKARPPRAFR